MYANSVSAPRAVAMEMVWRESGVIAGPESDVGKRSSRRNSFVRYVYPIRAYEWGCGRGVCAFMVYNRYTGYCTLVLHST